MKEQKLVTRRCLLVFLIAQMLFVVLAWGAVYFRHRGSCVHIDVDSAPVIIDVGDSEVSKGDVP